jgi:hypothetical protein
MADSQRTKMIALIAGGVVLALLAGAAAGWFARSPKVGELEDRVAELEQARDEESSTEITDEETAAETDEIAATDEAAAETEGATAGDSGTAPVASSVERQPGLIVDITGSPGAYVMRIDYVLWLTGQEAIDAAAAHGDESPPPNDYYVVNDNPKIREFPIQSGIPVTVVTNDDGTSDSEGHTITLAQWVAALSGPNADAFKATIYWITITDGTVTAIEAQYVP